MDADSRRGFLKLALAAGSFPFLALSNPGLAMALDRKVKGLNKDPLDAATDADFWAWIRQCYSTSPDVINLNSGGVSPQPKAVQEAHFFNDQLSNQGPSYYMWQIVDKGREPLRAKLATLAGCDPEELAINRNSTEGLNTVIFGLDLKPGDEVVLTRYDYPHMLAAWRQREKRDGIKLSWVDWDFPLENDAAIVAAYAEKITPKTKVVHVTHVINWVGQILPARAISDMAHARGCQVIVDGAHSFNHFEFAIPDTGADYFATSLHKWLGAPFGSGLLYIRKEKVKTIWPLLGDDNPASENIRKFENLGTRSNASEMAIGNAVDFMSAIGIRRKEARLRYLKDYWVARAAKIPRVRFHTSSMPKYSCGIASFSIDGWNAGEICDALFEKKKTFVTPIQFEKLNCVRVSPNLFNSTWELDRLVDGIAEIAQASPPKR